MCKIPSVMLLICDVERQPWIRGPFKLEANSVLDFSVDPSIKGASSERGFSAWFSGTAASPVRTRLALGLEQLAVTSNLSSD